ncbi:MAG: PilW family protein [Magnetococcales bacterium]|nr:PilW family protein [Magnetococcales bacterium]
MAVISPLRKGPRQRGFSLIEVMIAMSIGLVVLMAVISMLSTSSQSRQELDQSAQLIENGQYAIQVLYEDLRHAGFFGHYHASGLATPASLPDPCTTDDANALLTALAVPLHGYESTAINTRADLSATTCATSVLSDANLKPGSDLLVIRRADTALLAGVPTHGEVYLQANVTTAAIQFGSSTANVPTTTADGSAVTLTQRNGDLVSPANTRKLHVRIYFIAPCSKGSGASGICASGDDTIPTLKRLDLEASGGVRTMAITPLAEGIDILKLRYGLDTTPSTIDPSTGLIGDGIPDAWSTAPTLAQWSAVVSVQVHLLTRAPASSTDQIDNKTYQVGPLTVAAPGDGFRRHLFSTEVRPINLAGPRSMQ